MIKKNLKGWLSAICVALYALSLTACGGGGSTTVLTNQTPATKFTATGSFSTATGTIASSQSVSAPTGVTLTIPAGTTLTDASGNPVTGTISTSVSASAVASDLPHAAATLPTGNTLAAFADITLGTVKHFSQPVTLAINVTASGAKTGDAVTVYSFDSTNNTWTFAGTYIVDANGNVSPIVTHLSIWGVFKTATPPPVQPTGLTATAGDSQVTVSWNSVTGASSYNIYYGTAAGVTTAATKVSSSATSQLVTGLTDGTTYYFVVTALSANGESITSSEVSATPVLLPPVKPSGIIVSGGDTQATVQWNSVTGATSYNIYYSTTSGQELSGTKIAGAVSPQVVTGLTNTTTYYFVVTAVNAAGESPVSSEKSVTPQPNSPPGTPTSVVTSSPSAGDAHITWTAVSGATSYNVYYVQAATQPAVATVLAGSKASVATATADITGLNSAQTYWFLVTAVNFAGESGTQSKPKGQLIQ
ncbi:fibronectin type III domain-containing protein [Geomonas sp.]|uniref:fibronectin type III domain-containing protein n=1 Tax=Geomonas sp. TaxID=2651584 RepID=UPI002B46F1A0|nr:fibronectin type III domain-containing protein [Geomonas sp.]HJV35201.1 fibronectin type III domain-containing protein [Geomonas sp.]